MKNNLVKLFALLCLSTMLFATSKPSIEGRASVAERGDLPAGMYIKAHTFLPGDTVIITNPSTGVSVEAFVFETIDEGLAAIVSDEVADKLFITQNTDTLVQIRKAVAPAELAKSGFEILDEKATVQDVVVEDFIDDSAPYIPEVEVAEELQTTEELSQQMPVAEILATEETLPYSEEELENLETLTIVEVEKESIDTDEASSIEEPLDDAIVYTPFSDMSSLFATESLPQETESDEDIVELSLFEEPVVEESVIEEVASEESIAIEETPEIAFTEENTVEEAIEEIVVEEETTESEVEEIPSLALFEEPILDFSTEEIAVVEETPNILTATEENPPIFDGIEDEPEVTLHTDYAVEPVIEEVLVETEEVDIFALTPASEYIADPMFTGNINDFIVEDISMVDSKKFYIQLATYKDTSNIEKVLINYSDKYPLALVKAPTIANAYQVVIGPLTSDEYTVVLERFKSYGYKDAFLRIASQ